MVNQDMGGEEKKTFCYRRLELNCYIFHAQLAFWYSKGGYHCFHQTQHVQSAATDVGQEEHDANAATEFGPQRSADHV